MPPTAPAQLLYDADCGFCRFALAVVLALDRRRAIEPLGFEEAVAAGLLDPARRGEWDGSWHLVLARRRYAAGAAIPPLLALLPGLAPLGRVAARAPGVCERGYRAVARRRSPLGRLLPAAARRWAERVIARHGAGG